MKEMSTYAQTFNTHLSILQIAQQSSVYAALVGSRSIRDAARGSQSASGASAGLSVGRNGIKHSSHHGPATIRQGGAVSGDGARAKRVQGTMCGGHDQACQSTPGTREVGVGQTRQVVEKTGSCNSTAGQGRARLRSTHTLLLFYGHRGRASSSPSSSACLERFKSHLLRFECFFL
ncbi:hypothetical protein EJ04DRAFT_127861 [Polyplosphaeria fusca]|uniref:Uncharacterized protein n=1 Tax=Polyplosphaeria fusca TaxID=682080 RepID=A0A9P4QJX1_9PLEO|nr:hypothetical protein EJ04DRAFT_127861 [Polyplosphaeria fusca]